MRLRNVLFFIQTLINVQIKHNFFKPFEIGEKESPIAKISMYEWKVKRKKDFLFKKSQIESQKKMLMNETFINGINQVPEREILL